MPSSPLRPIPRHPRSWRWRGCLVALGLLGAPAQADLEGEMGRLFDALVNVTQPTAHLGQRRGVLSAGSVVTRHRLMDPSLVSFVPPSFEAGCGGIDLFGGSFSFINLEQFTQLLRAIASNAAGYAFQLALTTMAPSAAEVIEQLQKKVQQLNQLFGSSCQLAQGLVNDTVEAVTLTGLIPRLRALLVGDGAQAGLIEKFRLGVEDLSAEEKGFLEHAPLGLGGGIRTLARLEPGMARGFAERAAPILAVEMLQTLLRDLLASVRLATGALQHTHAAPLLNQLEAVQADLWTEYGHLAARHGNPNELLATYHHLLAQFKAPEYLDLTQAVPGPGPAETAAP